MDLSALMKMAGPLQAKMQQAAAARAKDRVEGAAGGGAVQVILRGDLTVEAVRIAPAAAAAAAGDVGMLEDLVAAALANALKTHQQRYGATPDEQMQKLMHGADLGGLAAMMGAFGR